MHEIADCIKLHQWHGLIMVSYAFNADGEAIDIFSAIPHGAPGMECFAVAVDNPVNGAFFSDAKVAFAHFREFVQTAAGGGFGRVKNY